MGFDFPTKQVGHNFVYLISDRAFYGGGVFCHFFVCCFLSIFRFKCQNRSAIISLVPFFFLLFSDGLKLFFFIHKPKELHTRTGNRSQSAICVCVCS